VIAAKIRFWYVFYREVFTRASIYPSLAFLDSLALGMLGRLSDPKLTSLLGTHELFLVILSRSYIAHSSNALYRPYYATMFLKITFLMRQARNFS
jgi:hypothetical protein